MPAISKGSTVNFLWTANKCYALSLPLFGTASAARTLAVTFMKLILLFILSSFTLKCNCQIKTIDTLIIFNKKFPLERVEQFYTGNYLTPLSIFISNYKELNNSYTYSGNTICKSFDTISVYETPIVNYFCSRTCSGIRSAKNVAQSFMDSIVVNMSERFEEFQIRQGNNIYPIDHVMFKLLRSSNDILISVEVSQSFRVQDYRLVLMDQLQKYNDVNGILIEQMLYRNEKNQFCCVPYKFLIKL
jgi:hypothetical protein